jgi:hypothetical protein
VRPLTFTTLGDWAPREFHSEFTDTRAYKFKDIEVVEECLFGWPGDHVNVINWVKLANGYAVGWNENDSRGWSFPVIKLQPRLEAE